MYFLHFFLLSFLFCSFHHSQYVFTIFTVWSDFQIHVWAAVCVYAVPSFCPGWVCHVFKTICCKYFFFFGWLLPNVSLLIIIFINIILIFFTFLAEQLHGYVFTWFFFDPLVALVHLYQSNTTPLSSFESHQTAQSMLAQIETDLIQSLSNRLLLANSTWRNIQHLFYTIPFHYSHDIS